MSLKKSLKNIIAALLLAGLVYLTGTKELLAALSQLSLLSLAYLFVLGFMLIFVSVLKWQLFLQFFSEKVSTFKLFNLYLLGYFVNLILPSYLGGDAVRSFYVGKKVGQHEAAAATILERYTGVAAMLLLGFTFMWQVNVVTSAMKIAVSVCLLGLIAATLIALHEGTLSLIGRVPALRRFVPHLEKVRQAFHLAKKAKGLLLKTMLLSFLYHSLTVLNTVAAAFAVGWFDPPLWDLFVVLPLILLIGAIPVSPNGLGMQEGAFYFFLQAVGATSGQALAVGLVLRAKSYALALLGWFSWLWVRRNDPRVPPQVASESL